MNFYGNTAVFVSALPPLHATVEQRNSTLIA